MKQELVIYKIGTGCISDGAQLNYTAIAQIIDYVKSSRSSTTDVLLVSSGAVAAGKELCLNCKDEQILAAVGQSRLMQAYSGLLPHLQVAQVLLNINDFQQNHEKVGKHKKDKPYVPGHIVELLQEESILPIINENDNLSLYGLKFSDNDELATLLATYLKPYYKKLSLVFMTKTSGVLDANGNRIEQLDGKTFPNHIIENTKSSQGRGGMFSKVKNAYRCAAYGVDAYITNGQIAKGDVPALKAVALNGTSIPALDEPLTDVTTTDLLKTIIEEANKRMENN